VVSEELVKRLRNLHDTTEEMDPFSIPQPAEAADTIEAQAAEIKRLREAGQKLNDHACHDDDCQIVTHGVWSDPIPCTCGYEDAWKAWSAALGETE
jgi:hypothetical protein